MFFNNLFFKNKNGSTTILCMGIITLLMGLMYLNFLNLKRDILFQRIYYRANLCHKFFFISGRNLINEIERFNSILKLQTFGEIIPSIYGPIKATKKIIMATQEILHVSFVKNILSQEKCTFQEKINFLINGPYSLENFLYLKRNKITGEVLKNKEIWSWNIKKIWLKNLKRSFSLSGTIKLKEKNTLISTFTDSKDLLNLK